MDMYNLRQIPSEARIKKYLKYAIYGDRFLFCPECHFTNIRAYEDRYRCPRCRCKFSLLSHTWLSNLKLPLQQWWMLLWCWTQKIPVQQASALTKLSQVTIYHWYDQFRNHLPEEYHVLETIVQLDEAYFKNWCLIMGKQIGSRKLAYDLIYRQHPGRLAANSFLFQKVQPGAKLWTDGASIYKRVEDYWPVEHTSDVHKKFEFTHTSEIEGTFGNLRTFIRRMYHHTSQEKFPDYVREFCFRFSSPELFESPQLYCEKTLMLVPTR
jgi:transposase-like protein